MDFSNSSYKRGLPPLTLTSTLSLSLSRRTLPRALTGRAAGRPQCYRFFTTRYTRPTHPHHQMRSSSAQIIFRPVEDKNVVLHRRRRCCCCYCCHVIIVVVITVVSSCFQPQASRLHPFHVFLSYRRSKLPREHESPGVAPYAEYKTMSERVPYIG